MGYEAEPEVTMYKKILCGDNPLGNWHYPFWRDVDCTCCAFHRGLFLGLGYAALVIVSIVCVKAILG